MMAKAIQGTEQNGPFSAAHRDTDTESDAVPVDTSPALATPAEELELLRVENAALRDMVEELEKLLEEKLRAEQVWTERQKDQDALLEEKSDVIRELHQKLQDRPATAAAPRDPAAIPREEELLALHEELEQERGQLKDDEEALMAQMREMEVQMSRDRAELARQRNELQRLHSEILHELELASRHAALRDRLQPLQRRHQEMLHQKKSTEAPREAPPRAGPNPDSAPPQEPPAREGSGLLRRLFG